MKPKVVCIIQARMTSTRLPGKVLLDLAGKPVLVRDIERVRDCALVDEVVVATSTSMQDDAIVDTLAEYVPGLKVYRGSLDDVLDRFYRAAKESDADIVVRVTSDCPLCEPELIDQVIRPLLDDEALAYSSNVGVAGKSVRSFPRGLDVEAFRFSALETAWRNAVEQDEREHVTPHIRRRPDEFAFVNLESPKDYSAMRWTLDTPADYKFIRTIYARLHPQNPKFRMKDILSLLEREPGLAAMNAAVEQKEVKI